MEPLIHHFYIIEKDIRIRENLLKSFIGNITAGVYRKRNALPLQLLCSFKDKIHIHGHNLSAGKSNSSAGLFIKYLVFQQFGG